VVFVNPSKPNTSQDKGKFSKETFKLRGRLSEPQGPRKYVSCVEGRCHAIRF
jgi:hypothetical protein